MTTTHTVHAFDNELAKLTERLAAMGVEAEAMFTEAVHALVHADSARAQGVRARDGELDRQAEALETEAINLIARRQPLAVDLRLIMAVIRIASNLERVGDLASNIAKRASAMTPGRQAEAFSARLEELGALAVRQLRAAREAFATRDATGAQLVRDRDTAIDELHTAVFRDIVTALSRTGDETMELAHLLFCAKNIERVGDHATNIAENVLYVVSGVVPEERLKHDDSSTSSS